MHTAATFDPQLDKLTSNLEKKIGKSEKTGFLSEIGIIRFCKIRSRKILFFSDLTSVLYFGRIFCRLNCGFKMLYNSFVYEMSCLYFVSVPRDCPTGHKIPQNPAICESRVPGLGLNIRGTAGTGTDICGTVPRSLCPGTENSRDSRDCPLPIPDPNGEDYYW